MCLPYLQKYSADKVACIESIIANEVEVSRLRMLRIFAYLCSRMLLIFYLSKQTCVALCKCICHFYHI